MDRTKVLITTALLLLLVSCSRGPTLRVGSKNFSEQLILGEIVAQHLEKTLGVHVERKLDLGGTLLAHQSLVSGQIDLYPEYTGTALTTILKQAPESDARIVLDRVRAGYKQWNVEWLAPLGFINTFAMVVRKEEADARAVRTLSDAADYAPGWKLGAGYEFIKRPDGLAGLIGTYRINAKGSVKTMDLGLLYQALEQRQVDMVAGNSTDGLLSVKPFTVLEDDRHYFPPYEAAIVARSDAFQKFPGLRQALNALNGRISTDAMRAMNYQLDGRHRPAREIAKNFLK